MSYQLVGANSNGTTKVCSYRHDLTSHLILEQGALVHFTESLARTETSRREFSIDSIRMLIRTFTAITPWIALISCDANATSFSEQVDIFTMASDRGAQSAVRAFSYSYIGNYTVNAASVFSLFRNLCHQSSVCRPC